MRSRVLVIGSKGTEDRGQRAEDTFANSPFGLIIEATQALHIPWTLVGPLMGPGWGLGGPWIGPEWNPGWALGGHGRVQVRLGAFFFRRVLSYHRQMLGSIFNTSSIS